MDYQTWIKSVDNIMIDFCGMAHDDIPDYLWYSLYNYGETPEQAFDEWMHDPSYGFPSL